MAGVFAADVLLGADPNCARWLRRYRDPNAQGSSADGGRRERRRPRI
jgi:5-methyltetrahydrofolate--homocysteine methyltransferase